MTITVLRPQRVPNLFSLSLSELVDDFFDNGSISRSFFREPGFCPAADSYVKDNTFHFRLELPGVDPEDVMVSTKDGSLQISGERKRNSSEEDSSCRREEMSYGCFSRSFSLPEGTDTEKIHARFDKGVLEVSVPLPEALVEKVIPIEGVQSETKSMKPGERSEELPEAPSDGSPEVTPAEEGATA